METAVNRKLYEGMFLVDSAQAADWDQTKATIEDILKRGDSEIVEIKKWDDRRLAYEIDRKERGTYILCYFNAACEKISEIEKGVQLSEKIMRVLILSTEQMSADDIGRDTPTMKAEKEAAAAEEARAGRIADAEAKAKEAVDEVAEEGSEATAESSSVKAVAVAPDAEARDEAEAPQAAEGGDLGEAEAAETVESGGTSGQGVDVGETSAEAGREDTKEQDAP